MFRKIVFVVLLCFCALVFLYGYYYIRWRHLWQQCSSFPTYNIEHHQKDTLRILVIGDSWAEIHSELNLDTFLCSKLKDRITCPVSVVSKGKGGEKSRGIYKLLFENDGYGTKRFFKSGVDYCIIFAGINDAASNRGTKQYCHHYKLILDFLLQNNVRPVVVEIPDVDIWTMFKDKPFKDMMSDFIKSTMTQCKMYSFKEYRAALREMLQNEKLMDKVVYVPMSEWNGDGEEIDSSLFTEDKVHLNNKGYYKLDESIAAAIANHLNRSKNSTHIDDLVNNNAN